MSPDTPATEQARTRLLRSLAPLGVPLAGLLAVAGQFFLAVRGTTPWLSLIPGAGLYALAVLVLLASCVLREGPAPGLAPLPGDAALSAPPAAPRSLRPGLEWGLVAVLILGGLYLRVHRIDLIPPGLNNDEAINAIEAVEIIDGKPFATMTGRGHLNRETMFHYLAALSFANPGFSLNPLRAMPAVFGMQARLVAFPEFDRIFPLRAVSIAFGVLTLLALYLFVRWRFGWHVALLATLFLSVSPWHLLYSRAGLRAILAPPFAIAAVALFLKARDSGRLRDHVAWGVVTGLGLWTYTSFRAVPLAFLAYILLRRILEPQPTGPARRPALRPLLAAGGCVALLGGLVWLRSPLSLGSFLFRGAYATLLPRSNWGLNLLHSLTMLNYYPERYAVIESEAFISDGVSTTFGSIGLEPETVVVAALATMGLVYAAWRAARRRGSASETLPLLCVAALVLSVGWAGPSLTRMLLNLPWLCLFAALFAWRLCGEITALRPRYGAWAGHLVVAGAALLACAQGYNSYFLQAGRSPRAMEHFGAVQTAMGMYVLTLPEDQDVYVLHTRRVDTLRYLLRDRRGHVELVTDPSSVDLDAIARSPRTVAFVVEHARRFAEPLQYLINRYQLLRSTQRFADRRFDPDTPIFWNTTMWKDASGRLIPPPGTQPDAPAGMSFPAPPDDLPPDRQQPAAGG